MAAVQFGLSQVSTYDADTGLSETAGVMGIRLDVLGAGTTQLNSTPYPNIVSTMVTHGSRSHPHECFQPVPKFPW